MEHATVLYCRISNRASKMIPARHLPSGARSSKASCTGGQELRLAGLSTPLLFCLKVFIRADPVHIFRTQHKPYARSSPIVLRLTPDLQ